MLLFLFYLLALFAAAAIAVYIWFQKKDSEKKLEKDMKKAKDNL